MLYNLLQMTDQWLDSAGLYSVLQVLYQREFRAFSAVVLAFFIVMVFGKRMIRWLVKLKIGDCAEFDNDQLNALMKNKENTPTMGGLLLVGSIVVTTLLLADVFNRYVHLILAVIIVFAAVGSADDWLKLVGTRRDPGSRDGLLSWEKLLFQLGVGFIVGYFAWKLTGDSQAAKSLTLPLIRTYEPGLETLTLAPNVIILPAIVFIGIAAFLVGGMSNAVNFTDGLDGLAPGLMMIASFAVMVLCYIAGSPDLAGYLLMPYVEGSAELMVVAGASAGACLGFLWFNAHPAQVFMGDTGSLPLGGMLATIGIVVRQEFLVVIIGGVFLIELGSSFLQTTCYRWTKGKRLFRCAPIHHHFQYKGWSESQIVVRFWVIGVILAMLAIVSIKMR
ncbi:MAG: phospho-N-acetylmuramoyl-pentapeptide-transferase [Phycisphaerae bacterium]|jgi:phospho-N-acetylmuramoyl-pentapeptide-transferase|nr:phospho-N-acetylmuramoyl-pentapeptide-transferase [Phycisphaerae bacterium]HJN71604.1 phospho-N-acetylmuramoyl-pentapeptide-transferase [Phycisphaerales bacterium]|tara:strand:- start:1006 stop:2175 length:1170 start_codon:yes stop_codon:yes gene_type:complete